MEKIVFVSEMRNPHTNASSTQIMTKNLLYGFRKISQSLIFVPIIENEYDVEPIVSSYSCLCDEVIPCKSLTKCHAKPFKMMVSSFLKILYFSKKRIPNRLFEFPDYIFVSHSPSIDSILICEKIKKRALIKKFIQYWGDPYALSLITPKQFCFKRLPDYFIERRMHRFADKIVYGTKSLFDAEIELYPKIKTRASFVDVSFSPDNVDKTSNNAKPIVGYFGNYYSKIRNIVPFYESADKMPNLDFVICGSGDVDLLPKSNVKIFNRVPQSEVSKMESNIDIVICLLNSVGFQIPGKIFYETNTKKHILIILDGPYKESIRDELNKSQRFFFCENTTESIINALECLSSQKNSADYDFEYYNPPRICEEIIK